MVKKRINIEQEIQNVPVQNISEYSFPEYRITIKAHSLEEAKSILNLKMKEVK